MTELVRVTLDRPKFVDFELWKMEVASVVVTEDTGYLPNLNLGTPSATRRNWPALALSEIKPRPRPLRLVQSH